jgi:hypothetical protein
VNNSGHFSHTKYVQPANTSQPLALAQDNCKGLIVLISTQGTLFASSIAELIKEIALFTMLFSLSTTELKILQAKSANPCHKALNALCTASFTHLIVETM